MSLNRSEQMLHDYVKCHPDERQYIQDMVRKHAAGAPDPAGAVARIDSGLWRYFEERSAVVPVFKEAVRVLGPKRTSMKNLAELLVRLWVEPRPRATAPAVQASPENRI